MLHINALELLAIKLALLTFTTSGSIRSIHVQIENKTAISYLLKMGGAQQTITAFVEKDSALKAKADWESRNNRDSSD